MKRPLGQHFLFNPRILNKIIDCSNVTAEDVVVEIGPGHGTMTRLLAKRVRKVIAIELDKKLAEKLKDSVSDKKNIEVISANALKFPYDTIKGKFRVVANIPYYITTPLLFRLLEFKTQIASMTLLLQKEIAQRIIALPGNRIYGVLSISVQLKTDPSIKFLVSKKSFSPPPKVDSAVVYFDIFRQARYKLKNEDFFYTVVRTAFSQRRKTIANSLKPLEKTFADRSVRIREKLLQTGIDPGLRPEALSIKDFIKLSEALQNS